MKFVDYKHSEFFNRMVITDECQKDSERLSLFYILGMCDTLRENYKSIYDFEERIVEPKSLRNGWQTGTSIKLTRLALNLFNGWHGYDHDNEEQVEPAVHYTPNELFCHELAVYALEAVKIRLLYKRDN